MRIFGLEIRRAKLLSAVPSGGGGWFNIAEPFGGAWQSGISQQSHKDITAFSAVFSCITIIASDIAKLRIKLVEEDEFDICAELDVAANIPVLRKPNNFQNRIKFIEQWIVSKLLHGNAYILKGRDRRGVVSDLWVLDAKRVVPLVAESGDVYYQLSPDNLSGVKERIIVPATEIIHDSMVGLWHPLVGISPLYACAATAAQGRSIQANSSKFFENMSRPSGILVAPTPISDELAAEMKAQWDKNFSGENAGKTAVIGGGLTYLPMGMAAQEAQLIEQLKWTVEDVARCFHVPLFKLGGPVPVNNTIEALSQSYYSDCLQSLIESLELCLDEGLALPSGQYTEMDLDGLLRMDTAAQIESLAKAVGGAIMAPNEARAQRNLKPLTGGDTVYLQQQNFSLAALAKRDAKDDPFANANPGRRASDQMPPVDNQPPANANIVPIERVGLVATLELESHFKRAA